MLLLGLSPDLTRYFGEGNLANYSDNEALEILRDLYNVSDEKTFREKYEKLQNKYEEDRPYIGLYYNRQVLIHGKNLSTTVNSNWFNMFYDIENWNRKN